MVNGEYVAFCDSDDFYEHDYLEKMMFLFDKNVCMVACDFTRKAKPEKVKTKITQFSRLEAMSEIFCDKYLYGYIHTKIFRKEYLKDVSFDADDSSCRRSLFFVAIFEKLPRKQHDFAYK